jgi:F-type H+-transporting ATPase subunit delta
VTVCERGVTGGLLGEVRDGLRLVLTHGRAAWLRPIIEAFAELADAAQGRVCVTVRAARPLSDEMKRRLIEQLSRREQRQVRLIEETQPALMGGAQIQVGNRLIDGSMRTQLTALRTRLKHVRVS